MSDLHKKLFKLRQHVGKISKDASNPFFKSKYFDINSLIGHLQPLLDEHNLLLTQPIEQSRVTTTITDVDSGESVSSSLNLPEIPDPQKIGSAITYYRRYTLASLLALQAEDDDGNKASKPERKGKPILRQGTDKWIEAVDKVASGKGTLDVLKKHYQVNENVFNAEVRDRQNG